MTGSTTEVRPTESAVPALLQHGAGGTGVEELPRLPSTLQPHRNLLKYYLLASVLTGPAFLFAALFYYVRFRTLRYDIDEEGITMRWGAMFRREISLTYARIQDIQLTSNVVERWLGLARIQLQTASGNAAAEMTIEGIPDVDGMRDFLYTRMRGAAGAGASRADAAALPVRNAAARSPEHEDMTALSATLAAVADEIRALREDIVSSRTGGHDA